MPSMGPMYPTALSSVSQVARSVCMWKPKCQYPPVAGFISSSSPNPGRTDSLSTR